MRVLEGVTFHEPGGEPRETHHTPMLHGRPARQAVPWLPFSLSLMESLWNLEYQQSCGRFGITREHHRTREHHWTRQSIVPSTGSAELLTLPTRPVWNIFKVSLGSRLPSGCGAVRARVYALRRALRLSRCPALALCMHAGCRTTGSCTNGMQAYKPVQVPRLEKASWLMLIPTSVRT